MKQFRVRFAPSPTGALHIGGVRTALYNFLLARKYAGSFLLRIEDTDRARYVPGAEAYINEALAWCGVTPDESPALGGPKGPYRQSERRELYRQYAEQLLKDGYAYYAFDTPEELEAQREAERQAGSNFRYDSRIRQSMNNSLNMTEADLQAKLNSGVPYTVRLKVPASGTVSVQDRIRGAVTFQCAELDDKVMLKADGMPTYHLANVVDDYLMEITHVVRGEEWLPSTAHHVLLYRYLGWEDKMPQFAHLPLILKPSGKGKLSKRDGVRLGIPVFPLAWKGEPPEDSFTGFREVGFDPRAVVNFLAFLGWNPGTEQELFSMEELIEAFSIDKVGKAGARFDFEKAKWFNQQYIMGTPDEELAKNIRPFIEVHGHRPASSFLIEFCRLMKERVTLYTDFWDQGYYFFEGVRGFDEKAVAKKWRPERRPAFEVLAERLNELEPYATETVQQAVKQFMKDYQLKFGDVLPILRLALAGTMKGPAVFEMMALIGREEVDRRLKEAFDAFDALVRAANP